ncbi:MAG: SDR family NAD(P)-dependent oxidoreductase [Clostridia bacterium]|nr:SDR family NAD(P)-dependent oxidoreductase [Clostridia bacterium]
MNYSLGLQLGEFITVYPESIPSNIQSIKHSILEQTSQYQCKNQEEGQQVHEMDKLLCKLLCGQLASNGLLVADKQIIADNKAKIGFVSLYDRWLKESVGFLLRKNYLKYDGQSYITVDTDAVNMDAVWKEWELKKDDWVDNPSLKYHVALVETALGALPEILRGEKPATEVIFPDSSMVLVEGIYKGNPVCDYFNEVLADTLIVYIQERLKQDSAARLRILEIGAGTGGTSAAVFQKLQFYKESIKEYCYTDISKAFLLHAENEYGLQNPYLTYHIFDVEKPLSGQDIDAGGYDVVIATNVLHATKNIRQTLRNAKATLKNNGLFLINEISSNSLFAHLTFGLLEGWWLYDDQELRIPGCPGLFAETWQEVLESEGFRSVFFPAHTAHDSGQQIIVAESDGVVRQRRQNKVSENQAGKNNAPEFKKRMSLNKKPSEMQIEANSVDLLREKSRAYFRKLVSSILKIPYHKVDSSEQLEKYGIDSILVIQLTNALREVLSDISSTLLFEYQTIDALVEHFIKTQKDSLSELVGLEEAVGENNAESAGYASKDAPLTVKNKASFGKRLHFLQDREQETELSAISRDIAVIGLSGRYAGADNANEFWNNLKEGKNCITEIPEARWDWKKYFDAKRGRKGFIYSKWGGFVKDIDKFDPLFFHISPVDAERMDPQERLFLEVAYESIEDAGYTPYNLSENKKIGVFVGVMNGNYPTGQSFWSVANRVSYVFNFQGPSMAVDTACSSSLTAIHLALESLYNGTSECAVAGGVNLIMDPVHYLRLSEATMLSSDGQCKAFGDNADGFVDGEGVGAIVLKPLEKAVADGDHIYGVIKGSMVNSGGKTNGYTVPNPNAQYKLVSEALRIARVNPRTISYIEAHGTGTSLGDPIEVSGLTKAFQEYSRDKNYCAIGSVKSNIGHCESAAGIAAVTKVLLQLKYRQLVPSLHSKVLNPNIDFSSTPFLVQQELTEWKRPVVEINGESREYPRIAGISSFGAGGANTHIVIQEYISSRQEGREIAVSPEKPAVIVLSAKNEEGLRAKVQRILTAIREQKLSDSNLADVAYTLQVGREAMEERLAATVNSFKDLEDKLVQFLEGNESITELYRGQVKTNKDTVALFAADEDMARTVEVWITKGKYEKLLSLWVKGLEVDWNILYKDHKPLRISLPLYPFAKESYWVQKADGSDVCRSYGDPAAQYMIHPLLHKNTSNLYEQRFTSTFTGQEFFMRDHIVLGQSVLPGVAYLEMARAAVEQSAEVCEEDWTGVRIKDVVWLRPVSLNEEPVQIHIALNAENGKKVNYEIYSKPREAGSGRVIHSKGSVQMKRDAEVPVLDIQTVKAMCSKGVILREQCYKAFGAMGIEYGSSHQGLEKIFVGDGQVIAEILLPSCISDTADRFVLHPGLMDAALQSCIGLKIRPDGLINPGDVTPARPVLPFALQELETFDKCTSTMWAHVQYSEGSVAGGKVEKLDIDVYNDMGYLCIRMKGFSSRVFEKKVQEDGVTNPYQSETSGELHTEVNILTPVWDVIQIEKKGDFPKPGSKIVIVGGNEENKECIQGYYPEVMSMEIQSEDTIGEIEEKLESLGPVDHIIWIARDSSFASQAGNAVAIEQGSEVIRAFRLIKALLRSGYGKKDLGWSIITAQAQPVTGNDIVNPAHASLHGLIGSLAKEYPGWKIRAVDLESGCEWPAADIFSLSANSRGNFAAYRRFEWYGQKLIPVDPQSCAGKSYKAGGVYVVIGGAGGIGEAWSEYMVRTYKVRIVWIGRREKDEVIQSKIDRLATQGIAPVYISADAANRDSLEQAYLEIKKKYTKINGVIHSALVLSDQSLANMEEEQFENVFSAKANVSICMAQVFQRESLDFVMFFSSLQSFSKAAGQSNYASGCTFADTFAHQLATEWKCAVKVMNWGYWGSTGSVASIDYQQRMAQAGIGSIEPPEAMEALEFLLDGPINQISLIKTTKPLVMEEVSTEELVSFIPEKIPSVMLENQAHSSDISKSDSAACSTIGNNTDRLIAKLEEVIINAAAEVLGVNVQAIDASTGLNEYGFKPATLTEFVNILNLKFKFDLMPGMVFECDSLHGLAKRLISEYKELLSKQLCPDSDQELPSCITVPEHPQHIIKQNSEQIRLVEEIDDLLCRLLLRQLQSIGIFTMKSQSLPDYKVKTGLKGFYSRWLEESTAVLLRNNYLAYDGKEYSVVDTDLEDINDLWKEWERKKSLWVNNPDIKAYVVLVNETLRVLPEILTGKTAATEIMFPCSSMELVEGIYKNNSIADYFNKVLADTLVYYIQERIKQEPSVRIRILEIGAGTGGTSAMVFKRLEPYRDHVHEYCYSDLSKAFLMHAEREYGPKVPYLVYKIFDAEVPIMVQDIGAGMYDIVIATNVLHATKNIRKTLRNVKETLCKNGLLLLNEISSNNLCTHLTFGLLEGWWLYEDTSLRIPGCPGLFPDAWKAVLESEGLSPVIFPASEAHKLGQQIIVAQSNGIIRKRQQSKPHVQPAYKTSKQETDWLGSGEEKASEECFRKIQQQSAEKRVKKQGDAGITEKIVQDHVKELIIEKLSEALKVNAKAIDFDESFADYGLDSITGVQLVQLINQALMIDLETTSLFSYSSVNQLTAHILSQYKDILVKGLEKNAKCMDLDNSSSSDVQESDIVYPKTKRILRRKELLEGDETGKKQECTEGAGSKEPIAIIGMSGRFAGSKTVNDLWENLANGVDLVEEVTRWNLSQYHTDNEKFCKYGSFLESIEKFDSSFFNISGLEATYMDPQQRLFLEESWKALEDAGYAGAGVEGCICGVYVGCGDGDYNRLFGNDAPAQAMWGNNSSVIPARIAYYLNLRGPAISVNTACSSSLVAIHLACQGLWTGETEMALGGGVFIQCTPEYYIAGNRAEMMSPSGRCRTFDQKADGFVPGEGVGVVVLKRLKDAIEDGDHIYGVIRGSGINQDGTTNGITAPSANSQESLERYVYDAFNISAGDIQMVEAHGTGTKLGDPIEFGALARAFRKDTDKKEYCAIGSIKTNLGHTATAAGVAGVIKILLSLKHRQIPASLHFESVNSNIRFEGSPFYINTHLKDWEVMPATKRCAAVSSFGFSGTNAHMVIEEAPAIESKHSEKPGYLIVLSARSLEQLQRQAGQLIEYCEKETRIDCGNVSYTLLLGRKHFAYRLACVARSWDELGMLLKKWLRRDKPSQVYLSEPVESANKEQAFMKRFGNECIQNCLNTDSADEYLEYLSTIASLYTQGYSLEFEKLFSNERFSKIPLPTYPFSPKRYWVAQTGKEADDIAAPYKIKDLSPAETLQDQVVAHTGENNDGVRNDFENTIVEIWKEVLGIEKVGIYDNFQELGGDSIMATRVISRLRESYPFELSLKELFTASTVAGMAELLEREIIEKLEELPEDAAMQLTI